MKKLLLLIFFIFSFTSKAQLDREHWFAPMMDEVGNGSQYQSIYMSTNETVPFRVDIYNNNTIVGTATISKNNPVKYSITNTQRGRIITTSPSSLFKPVPMGFYLKGEKPFFASLRFSINNHGEIQTSKGTAGLGTEFRAVMAPITVNNGILNFMNSIMATEDNTRVTITDFNPNVTFADFVNRTQFNFTLNKGQSYIIEGTGSYSTNYTGYIGAKIVSDKPVVIANGNFNGQYAGNFSNSSDILMDQGVPIDKLGQEFVLMKGNGDPGSNMEKGIILATENGTEIYLNNGTTPVATLNAGQYFLTPTSAYINQGFGHYNMLIKSSKNVYVYQLLAGTSSSQGNEEATGGFNYIPPLNCYLPKKIDEIGLINENYFVSNGNPGGLLNVPTKLNIITESGATIDVKRNGVSLPMTSANGPFNVLGNNNWVTYNFPNISGNVAVFSSAAVTAGISAGNDAVGYGGYFAGFSSIPLILKTDGDCLPGVTLEVTEGFDLYEWLIKNAGGTYDPAPGVNNLFQYEPTQAGIYAVRVKQGSCPEIQTKDFKFFNCTTFTNYDFDTCSTQTITPQFALSSQSINIPTIVIDTPPTKGNVVKNPDGTLTYTANPNATGTDTFKFSFCGTGTIPDCETVQATVHLNQIEKYDVVLNSCSATSTATYDLTSAAITPDVTVTKKYFSDPAYTNQIPVGQLTNYVSAPGFVYVQMSNTFGCSTTATIELKIKAPPVVTPSLYTGTTCDEGIDGIIDGNYKVDLTTITPTIVQNPTNFTTRYFTTQAKAISGLPADVITGNYVFTANTSVWIRVDSPDTCPPVIKEVFLKIGAKPSLITLVASKDVCDLLENNTENINLADYIPLFTTATGTTATYFDTLIAAQNNTPTIPAAQTITANKTFYYRLNVPGFCNEIGTLNIILSKGTPTALANSFQVCDGSSITLTAEDSPIYTAWLWKKGAVTISTTRTATLDAGVYTISFTNGSGCIFTKTITVTNSPKPILNAAAFTTTYCDSNFDGISDSVNFNNITPIIVTNFAANPGVFTVKYYLNAGDRDANNGNTIPNLTNFTFTANTTIYFRVDSPVCAEEKGQFDLKFNNSFTLISPTVSTIICDNNLDNTENINLGTFRNLFTTDATATLKYYATFANAQNNTAAIPAAQTITGDKTFYYRFSKTGLCDAIGTLNISFKASTPTALLDNYSVCDGSSVTLNAENSPTYNAWLWKKGTVTISTTRTATLDAGVYTIEFTNASGCIFTKTITVTNSPKPIVNAAAFTTTYCDSNFDGISDPVNFNTITPIIVTNFAANPGVFTVKYYLNAGDRDANNGNTIPNLTNFTFTANTTIYFRVDSPVCAEVKGQFDLKFNNSLILPSTTVSTTICDNNIDGTETISLANYRNLFTTETGVSATYFATLADARNNTPTINASQPITGNKTFYYRFKKAGLCDAIGTLNIIFKASTPTSLLDNYLVCQGESITLLAENSPTYTAWLWKKGTVTVSTTRTATLDAGVYTVSFTNGSGCIFTKTITVTNSPKPALNIAAYNATNCDDNFDGVIEINLKTVTTAIVPNANLFVVKYYTTQAFADAGGTNNLPDNWSYTTNTSIYVRVEAPVCPFITGKIDFKFGNNLPLLNTTYAAKVCDDDFDGVKSVNLADYKINFTTDSGVTATYHNTLADAQNKTNPILPPTVTVTNSGTYYLRFHKNNFCDVIGKLDITIQKAVKSDVLVDQNICPEATTTLDAGPGFNGYIWSTGETTQTIEVPVGDYWVDLLTNGCTYRQNVSVKAVELPKIVSVEIVGSTVTVTATGGNPPYQYAIDGGNYQTSNVFTNVRGGDHTIYVISADNCEPVTADINVIELYNVITPNNDGVNDVFNYSALLNKNDPFLQIYDRYGKLMFTGDKNNKYSWDGKTSGKAVATGSYWYVMKWKEPGFETVTEYSGWVLVKNRE